MTSTLIRRFHAACICAIVAVSVLASSTPAQAGEVIYQAFDERFDAVRGKLDRLAEAGFTAVQVSPVSKSIPDAVWYGRYQPIDLRVIEGPLGDESDLRDLIASAHGKGLKVLIDVVLNHMADQKWVGGTLTYPEFDANDFHYPAGDHCIGDYRNRHQVTKYWMCDQNAHLPDLDTGKQSVRDTHKRFLQKLLDLGADGFRFDATKHVEPEYWADLMRYLPNDKYYYGEVIGETLDESYAYTGMMPVTDFHLLRTMLSAFSLNGDLGWLLDPESAGGALPGRVAVNFARNHDTAMHPSFFNFGEYRDAMLANAYVISRGVGDILVYRDDANDALTKLALRFNRSMRGHDAYVRRANEVCADACDSRTSLFVERGGKGVAIINSADAWLDVARAQMPGLDAGCYQELTHGFKMRVATGGDGKKWVSGWGSASRGGLNVGPRTAFFFAKVGTDGCGF